MQEDNASVTKVVSSDTATGSTPPPATAITPKRGRGRPMFFSPERSATCLELIEQGKTHEEVARHFGICAATVSRHLDRLRGTK